MSNQQKSKELVVTLRSNEHGFKDYDVKDHPDGIRRAKVPEKIYILEIFNVYIGDSLKMGCPWRGNIVDSLSAFSLDK